jgi:hypothetical protein
MPVYHHPFNPSRGGGFGPFRGAQALFQALGGQGRQEAMDTELDRLAKMDLQRSQMGLHDAQATAAREKTRLERDQFDAQQGARNLRMDPAFLSRVAGMRLPELAPADVSRVVKRGMGGPYEMPPGIDPMQLRLLGETLSGVFAGGAADGPTNAEQMANVVTRAGSSAQRLAAPQLAAEDPITAAFALNAGTGHQAPALYGALPTGVGTFGTLTGALNYDSGMKGAVIGKSEAEAAKHRAAAAQSYAAAAASNASAAKTRLDMNRHIDPDRGGATDLQTGIFKPWTMVGGAPVGPKKSGAAEQKPLPASALTLQQEDLDAIGTASAIDSDLGRFADMIESGELTLGPVRNKLGEWGNWAGQSTPNSRNLQSFNSALEKMRNDSLRLNKGVQTEGDAQRAWNELLANINDGPLVTQRLNEIRAINRRAVDLRRAKIDILRANFGHQPLDISGVTNVAPAVGISGGAPAPAPESIAAPSAPPPVSALPSATAHAPQSAGRRVVRTGVSNGRRVVQYDDGSIEYAE